MRHPSDVFSSELERTEIIVDYIWHRFESITLALNLDYVIEKTCVNFLRVDFVDRVLPDATYIYIFWDGMVIAASAMNC